jgi:lysozyme
MIKGFDISHHNNINWSKVDPNVKFVYVKATQGKGFKDPEFNDTWQLLKSKPLYRGAYHFLTATDSAEDQANNFLSLGIDFSKPNVLPPVLDVEDQVPASLNVNIIKDKVKFIKLVTDWINIVEQKTERKVVIYSYKNFFKEYLNNTSWTNNYLWLASYQPTPPGLPVGYKKWDFWQYSQDGTIDGKIHGADIDLDYFNGTIEDLNKL